jgi:hypothetical protein
LRLKKTVGGSAVGEKLVCVHTIFVTN